MRYWVVICRNLIRKPHLIHDPRQLRSDRVRGFQRTIVNEVVVAPLHIFVIWKLFINPKKDYLYYICHKINVFKESLYFSFVDYFNRISLA